MTGSHVVSLTIILAGSLQPQLGGAIVAHNTGSAALAARVKEDPFVAQKIVSKEILDISPARADDRLNFLLA